MAEAEGFEKKLKEMSVTLNGDPIRAARFSESIPSISSRVRNVLFGSMRGTHGPTGTHRQQLEIAQSEFDEIRDQLKQLLEDELEAFEQSSTKPDLLGPQAKDPRRIIEDYGRLVTGPHERQSKLDRHVCVDLAIDSNVLAHVDAGTGTHRIESIDTRLP